MNIGVIVDNDFNHDVRVQKEVQILKNAGHELSILCFGFKGKQYEAIEGISIERIGIRPAVKNFLYFFMNRLPFYEWLWQKRISRFIKNHNIDVLHVHDLYMSKAAHQGIKNSNRDCSLILDLHENYPVVIHSYNWTKGLLRKFLANPNSWQQKEKEYLSYASQIIVLSEFFKEQLLAKYPFLENSGITVFPNIIDFKRFNEFKVDPSKQKSNLPTLLYFGVVAERRGIFDAIEATRQVLKKGVEVSLLVIGPVDKADAQRFFNSIHQPDLKPYIKYIPWIDLSELPTYLHISDICLAPFLKNPHHESGVANKIYQYLYGKKPIVASDCRPQKELIESFNCGLVYSSQEEFADCLMTLVDNPQLRSEMGNNGFSSASGEIR